MPDQKVEYKIGVTREGDGATVTTEQFKQVDAAAKKAGDSIQVSEQRTTTYTNAARLMHNQVAQTTARMADLAKGVGVSNAAVASGVVVVAALAASWKAYNSITDQSAADVLRMGDAYNKMANAANYAKQPLDQIADRLRLQKELADTLQDAGGKTLDAKSWLNILTGDFKDVHLFKDKMKEAADLIRENAGVNAVLETQALKAQEFQAKIANAFKDAEAAGSKAGSANGNLIPIYQLTAKTTAQLDQIPTLKKAGATKLQIDDYRAAVRRQYGVQAAALQSKMGEDILPFQQSAQGLSQHQIAIEKIKKTYGDLKEEARAYYNYELSAAGENEEKITAIQAEKAKVFEKINTEMMHKTSDFYQSMTQFADAAGQQISASLSSGIVTAFRNGKFEADQFFSDLAAQIAQIAINQALTAAIGSASGGTGLLGSIFSANGGQYPRLMAGGGMAAVSSPTYYPGYNVIAGEAGREVLTVLSKPRLMEIGGMAAQVGYADGKRLAITSADALEQRGGGGGGMIHIRIDHTPETQAQIVSNSVQQARVQVAQDLRSDTPISRNVKGLTA